MRPHSSSLARSLFASYLLILLLAGLADAQTAQFMPVQPRITRAVDEAQLATLKGNTHPLARAQFDRGAAAPTLALERMLLVLKRSPEQEAALITLLDQQQDKSSPNYHKWLTPEELASASAPPMPTCRPSPAGCKATASRSPRSARDAPSSSSPARPPWSRKPFTPRSTATLSKANRTGPTPVIRKSPTPSFRWSQGSGRCTIS